MDQFVEFPSFGTVAEGIGAVSVGFMQTFQTPILWAGGLLFFAGVAVIMFIIAGRAINKLPGVHNNAMDVANTHENALLGSKKKK